MTHAALTETDQGDPAAAHEVDGFEKGGTRMQIRWLRKALRNLNEDVPYIAAGDIGAISLVVRRLFEALSNSSNGQALLDPVAFLAFVNVSCGITDISFPIAFVTP